MDLVTAVALCRYALIFVPSRVEEITIGDIHGEPHFCPKSNVGGISCPELIILCEMQLHF